MSLLTKGVRAIIKLLWKIKVVKSLKNTLNFVPSCRIIVSFENQLCQNSFLKIIFVLKVFKN